MQIMENLRFRRTTAQWKPTKRARATHRSVAFTHQEIQHKSMSAIHLHERNIPLMVKREVRLGELNIYDAVRHNSATRNLYSTSRSGRTTA